MQVLGDFIDQVVLQHFALAGIEQFLALLAMATTLSRSSAMVHERP